MISIIVCDDHSIVREGIRHVIEREEDLKLCGEAADGSQALELIAAEQPDVAILDITMPGLGGLETLERLRSEHPDVKTILLSVHAETPVVRSAVALAPDGYVLKSGPPQEIVTAIRTVVRGGSYFSPTVARAIVTQMRESADAKPEPFSVLSTREREVLRCIAEGLSSKEIATQLGLSTKTIEAHRASLMRKVSLHKATDLVRYAIRHGLIEA